MSYSSEVLADSPWGYWRDLETTGTTLADSSGNSRSMGLTGSPTLAQPGPGSEKSISWPNSGSSYGATSATINTSSVTHEFWIYMTSYPSAATVVTACEASVGSTTQDKSVYVFGSGRIGIYTYDGTTHDVQSAGTVITLNTWHHVVASVGAAGTKVRVDKTTVASNSALVSSALFNGLVTMHGGLKSNWPGTQTMLVSQQAIYTSQLSDSRTDAHFDAMATPTVTGALTTGLSLAAAVTPVGAVTAALVTTAALSAAVVPVGVTAAPLTASMSLTAAVEVVTATPTVGAATVFTPSLTAAAFAVYTVPASLTTGVGLAANVSPVGITTAALATTVALTAAVETGGDVAAALGVNVTLSADAEAGPRTNPATGGRVRDSYAVATWDPPIVDPPDVPFPEHAYVSADAYTSVTMNGTRPTLHDHLHTQRRRHRDRIVIAGRDITYWRGIPTPIPAFGLVEPLLYGSGSLELPQVVACYETPGAGGLSWLVSGAPVQIQRVKDTSDGPVVITDWRGILLDFDTSGRTLTVGLAGDATGRAALLDKQPPIFKRRADLGYHWWDDITDIHRPFHPPQGPSTGITLYGFGGMRLLDHMQQLSAKGVQVSGTQWTCMPTEGDGTYRVIRKDTTTIDATAYLDDALTVASLRRDPAEEPNRVFATGVTPGGRRVKFGVYPVLADNQAPVFLGTLHPGDTGDNVTALLVRLYATGYLTAADRPGGYDADATAAVKELQDDAGLPQTGNVNLATWEALFSVGVTGYNLNGSHIEPAAQRDNVRRYLRDAAGNVIGQNTNWDRHALVVDKTLDMGTGITHQQMHAWAREELAPTPGDPGPTDAANNWVGTITFNTGGLIHGHHHPGDPVEVGNVMHARELRPGMNIWLPLFDGGTLLHVSGVNVAASTGLVSATVDTQARDTMKVWEVIARNVETRRDPARAWMQDHRSSRFVKDAVTEFDEVGGTTNDVTLPGGWTVFPVVAGQEGTIARLRLELKTPAEFVVAVFGHRITRGRLAQLIGNPLDHAGAKHWDSEKVRRTLDRDYITLYVAGDDQAPCGYYPGVKQVKTWTPQVPNPHYNVSVPADDPDFDNQETIPKQYANPNYNPADPDNDQEFLDVVRYDELTPLTGRWDDDASFGYRTFDDSCVLWVALYTHRPNTLTGGRIMWPQLEAGS